MALKDPDMDKCTPKKERCLDGINKGLLYTPGEECNFDLYDFNSETCDCEEKAASWTVRLLRCHDYSSRSFGSGFVDCSNINSCTYVLTYTNVSTELANQFSVTSYFGTSAFNGATATTICAYCVPDDNSQYEACETSIPTDTNCGLNVPRVAAYGPQSVTGTQSAVYTQQTYGCWWNGCSSAIICGGAMYRWYRSGSLTWEITPET